MGTWVQRVLFETSLGDRLLAALERVWGVTIVPVETIDEVVTSLLDDIWEGRGETVLA